MSGGEFVPNNELEQQINDANTWLAEVLNGSMRTTFRMYYHETEDDLISDDFRSMNKVINDAIVDAEKLAVTNPELAFERRRRRLDAQEQTLIKLMAKGQGTNTLIVPSDFPLELWGAEQSIGGYNIERKQTMLRVITRDPDGNLTMRSQSLDGSNRQALEAIYQCFGLTAQPGELLAQPIAVDIDPSEQPYVVDRLMGIYDRSLNEQFGGEWHAGLPQKGMNTYEFVRANQDLVSTYIDRLNNEQISRVKLRRELAAAMEARWLGDERPRKGTSVTKEMQLAGLIAEIEKKVYSGCGLTIGSEEENNPYEQAGYGSKIKKMHCPFCNAEQMGDPCSPNQKCNTCHAEVKNGKVTNEGNGGRTLRGLVNRVLYGNKLVDKL